MVKVSRSLKQLAIKVKMQGEALSKKLGRDPTIEEIAEELGVEKEDVVMAIESNFSVEYLQGVIHEEEGSPICLIDKISRKGDNEEDKVVDNILLKEVLGKLEKRERHHRPEESRPQHVRRQKGLVRSRCKPHQLR